jgi:uncharacterized protein (DUF927 family)
MVPAKPALLVQATPPPWANVPLPAGYALGLEGLSIESNKSRIAGPVWVAASTVDEHSGIHGIVIRWVGVHSTHGEITATRAELLAYGSTLAHRLADAGLAITPGNERGLLKYLAEFDVTRIPKYRSVTQLGWIDSADGAIAYLLPSPTGLISLDSRDPVIFQPERDSPSLGCVYPQGSLAEWQKHVLEPCRQNPLLLFAILTALAGPMLRYSGLENGGFHYYGRSSHGKTTAAQAAASVWGNGSDPAESASRALIQKWNTTANALEALVSAHNDAVLILDEIHTCEAKDFGSVVYNIVSGRGKQALNRDRQLRKARIFRALILSTGEVSARSKLEANGAIAHTGQLLRLIDIPIHDGVITETSGKPAGEFADGIKRACGRHFGSAGPAFLRALVAEYDHVRSIGGTIMSMCDAAAHRLTPADAPAEQVRAVKRFALVEATGLLALRLGILDCSTAQIEAAVQTALIAWRTDGENQPDRIRGVLNVINFIARHESRFQGAGVDREHAPRDRAGFIAYDRATGGRLYLFTTAGFREACGGLDQSDTAQALKSAGYLIAREAGRYTEKKDVGGERQRVYIINASVLGFDPCGTNLGTRGALGSEAAGPSDSST